MFKVGFMKILHLIDSFDARFERDQIKLIELLEKRGYHNTVITSSYSSDWRFVRKVRFKNWEKRFSQTEIIHEPSLKILIPFSNSFLPIYLPSGKIFRDFDVIHAYTFGTYSSFLSSALKKLKKSKVILRLDLSAATYSKAERSLFYRTVLTLPFRIADVVYAYSKLEKQYLANLGVQESKIWIIPVGIDFAKFSNQSIEKKDESITIGYLGRFCMVKGIHRIIPALCAILSKEKRVRVIFTGILEDLEYANNVIKQLKKYKNFEYLGNLSMSPVRFYNMCDVILIPSIFETGAITVLEAMASGKVVIASCINPIKEYIQHGRTGFLFYDSKEVYLYLKRIIENPYLIEEIGRRAREKAAKYDWRLIIRKYEQMYKEILYRNN